MGTPFARVITRTVALLVLFVIATTRPALADNWIDAATGMNLASGPIIPLSAEERRQAGLEGTGRFRGVLPSLGDRNRAFDAQTGRNFFRDANCIWRDAKTGERIASGPIIPLSAEERRQAGLEGTGHFRGVPPSFGDRNRAFDPASGRNFVRVSSDCSPKRTTNAPPPATDHKTSLPQTGLRTTEPLPQTCGDARDRAQAIAMGCIADPNAPAQLYTGQPRLPPAAEEGRRDGPPPCTGPYCYDEPTPDAGRRDVPGYAVPPYGNPYGGYPDGYGGYPYGDRGYPYGAPYSYPGAGIPGPR